jgi:GNAT superfamily N-acetyltransferase
MRIIDYSACGDPTDWLEKIEQGDWSAAKFLAEILREGRFHSLLGEGTLYLLTEGDELISFVTLTRRDCIEDENLYPWLGFFYTFPAYRGHHYGGQLLDFATAQAEKWGYPQVYIATDHLDLYEKYGFTYIENRMDIYGVDSRVYFRNTEEKI